MKNSVLFFFIFFAFLQIQAQTQTASEIAVFDALIKAKTDDKKYYCQMSNYELSRYLSAPELENNPTGILELLNQVKTSDELRRRFYEKINYYYSSNQTLIKEAFNCEILHKNKRTSLCKEETLNEFINIVHAIGFNYEKDRDAQYNATGETYTVTDEAASYIGGEAALIKFVREKINYPDYEKETDIQGRVLVTFIIEKDGQISNFKIIKGVSEGLNDEAKRVIKLTSQWKVGKKDGQTVRTIYNLPINFTLQ